MPSRAADSSKTSFDTSSKAFLKYMKIVAERDWYPLLRAVIGVAVYINLEMASIVPISLLKHRKYGSIGLADH